jgi:5'-nucleotidase
MNNIALFDMDGSLADYEGAIIRDLEDLRSPDEPILTADNIWTANTPYILARIKLIKSQPGWWLNLPPIEWGMDVFHLCMKMGFENHILTKGPKKHPNAWDEKVRWCQKYLGIDTDIHITSDKGLVYGKILYDDYPEYMLRWLKHRCRGLGIMPVTTSNKDFSHPNVIRYAGIQDLEKVAEALKVARDREPGHALRLAEPVV